MIDALCQEQVCAIGSSCPELYGAGRRRNRLYPIELAKGGGKPRKVYCEMTLAGGGWTLAVVFGKSGRPTAFSGAYPRPGASFYGAAEPDLRVLDAQKNDGEVAHYSIEAGPLWARSSHEVLAYVGGGVDDYVTAKLPGTCNFFDLGTICAEDTYGPFRVRRSNGSLLTERGYACTTAHRQLGHVGDAYDEFGLHLLDGMDLNDGSVIPPLPSALPLLPQAYHCHSGDSLSGHERLGRIFTGFQSSDPIHAPLWRAGVWSSWASSPLGNTSGNHPAAGALFIR